MEWGGERRRERVGGREIEREEGREIEEGEWEKEKFTKSSDCETEQSLYVPCPQERWRVL